MLDRIAICAVQAALQQPAPYNWGCRAYYALPGEFEGARSPLKDFFSNLTFF